MKEKVLVTGGSGFIGYHTVEELIKQKCYDITIFDNLSTGKIENNFHPNQKVKFILGDLRNSSNVENAIKNQNYIIHLGASLSVPESMIKPELYQATNVQGTFNVLYYANKYNIKKVVLASTCAVAGNSYYGLSKKITEDMATWFTINYNLPTTCLRYVNVFGERQPFTGEGAVVPAFINSLLDNKNPIIHGTGEQTRDYIYVKDVAEANVHAMQNEFNGISYIATGQEISVNTLLAEIASIMNKQYVPIFKEKRKGDMMSVGHHYPDPFFNWKPKYTLREGLKNTIEYFKKERDNFNRF